MCTCFIPSLLSLTVKRNNNHCTILRPPEILDKFILCYLENRRWCNRSTGFPTVRWMADTAPSGYRLTQTVPVPACDRVLLLSFADRYPSSANVRTLASAPIRGSASDVQSIRHDCNATFVLPQAADLTSASTFSIAPTTPVTNPPDIDWQSRTHGVDTTYEVHTSNEDRSEEVDSKDHVASNSSSKYTTLLKFCNSPNHQVSAKRFCL